MSWLFRQVWVWILIAFVLGLILTWVYVVHKASRTVEATDDSRLEDEPEADHDDSHHGAAVVGGVAAAGAGVAGAAAATTHHEDADQRDGGDQDGDSDLDEAHDADATAGASAGSSKTANDSDEAPTEAGAPADDQPFDQDAPVGGEPTAANDSVGSAADKTTASSSRDDQPEAAGAAAAARARAQAEEQRDTAPTVAADEAPDVAVDDAAGQSADGDLTEQVTDGDTAVKAGAAGVGVAAATGIGVAAVHHERAAEAPAGESAEGQQPADEAPPLGKAETPDADQDPMRQQFGSGAASPRLDGSAPDGYTVKGNADSMLFHTKDSPRYASTRPQVWFKDEASATSAGFAHWDRTKRGTSGTTPAHAAHPHPTGDTTGSSGEVGTDTAATTPTPTEEAPVDETPADDVRGETAVPQNVTTEAEESEPDPITEQFGSGAASPREDGSAPSLSYTIKGNADTMMFHTEDSPGFDDTEAEIWFRDEASAKAAGFIHWDRTKR